MDVWTKDHVKNFLISRCNINQHDRDLIESEDIDGNTISELDEDMLVEIGFEGAQKIYSVIQKLSLIHI